MYFKHKNSLLNLQCWKIGLRMAGMLDQIVGWTAADQAVTASIKAAVSDSSESWQNIPG